MIAHKNLHRHILSEPRSCLFLEVKILERVCHGGCKQRCRESAGICFEQSPQTLSPAPQRPAQLYLTVYHKVGGEKKLEKKKSLTWTPDSAKPHLHELHDLWMTSWDHTRTPTLSRARVRCVFVWVSIGGQHPIIWALWGAADAVPGKCWFTLTNRLPIQSSAVRLYWGKLLRGSAEIRSVGTTWSEKHCSSKLVHRGCFLMNFHICTVITFYDTRFSICNYLRVLLPLRHVQSSVCIPWKELQTLTLH